MTHLSAPRNNIGIFNSRATMQEYLRESKRASEPAPVIRTDVTRHDLETWAAVISAKYQLAIWHKRDVCIRELERQLSTLAEYAGVIS
jgi:hypothetical protein